MRPRIWSVCLFLFFYFFSAIFSRSLFFVPSACLVIPSSCYFIHRHSFLSIQLVFKTIKTLQGEFKRSKHERERERDVSEKVALGLSAGAAKLQGDAQFDARLFNQSEGMSSGFGAEDDYNVSGHSKMPPPFLSSPY